MTDQNGQIIKAKGEGVSLAASPVKMVKDGQRAAKALMDVIRVNPKWAVNIQNNEYLVYEAWQTVAQFFGCAIDTSTKPEYKQYGDAIGFEAIANVIDKKTGVKIGGATALCLNDEANWRNKPLFQLESMAQTRAGSKALRNQFSWVVVLAGYKPTPAEEVVGTDVKPFNHDQKGDIKAELKGDRPLKMATDKQKALINDFIKQGRIEALDVNTLTIEGASKLIEEGFKIKPKAVNTISEEVVEIDPVNF